MGIKYEKRYYFPDNCQHRSNFNLFSNVQREVEFQPLPMLMTAGK